MASVWDLWQLLLGWSGPTAVQEHIEAVLSYPPPSHLASPVAS